MIDLAGIDEVTALAAAKIDAVPVVAVERKAGDGQRLSLDQRKASNLAIFLSPSLSSKE